MMREGRGFCLNSPKDHDLRLEVGKYGGQDEKGGQAATAMKGKRCEWVDKDHVHHGAVCTSTHVSTKGSRGREELPLVKLPLMKSNWRLN